MAITSESSDVSLRYELRLLRRMKEAFAGVNRDDAEDVIEVAVLTELRLLVFLRHAVSGDSAPDSADHDVRLVVLRA